jgi:hypothetical protein
MVRSLSWSADDGRDGLFGFGIGSFCERKKSKKAPGCLPSRTSNRHKDTVLPLYQPEAYSSENGKNSIKYVT